MSYSYSNPYSPFPSSASAGGANRGRGRNHSGHGYGRGRYPHAPCINGIDDAASVPAPPPPSSSSMAALLSRSGSRHPSGIASGTNAIASATRVDRLVVHPTAPPLPYSHNSNLPDHTSSSSSSQRVTSRFWTNPASGTPPAYPATPSTSISSFFSNRQPTGSTPGAFAATPHRPHPPTFLPTPAQNPRLSSISSPTFDRPFIPATQVSATPRPFSSRGSAAFGAPQPSSSQPFAFPAASRAPSFSPSPPTHFHAPPPPPPPPPAFVNQRYSDQALADLDHQLGPRNSPSPPPRPASPPPANDVIAEFRARLNRQPAATQAARQPPQAVFSWDKHHSSAAAAAPQPTLGYRPGEPEDQTEYDTPQAVGSNVFAALAGTRPAAPNQPYYPETAERPGHDGPPPPPSMTGPLLHQVEGMVPAMQLAMSNGGRLPVKPVSDLPPRFRGIFSFPCFNYIQTQCYDHLIHSDKNLVVSSPTGSGKTALLDLALIRLWTTHPTSRAVYLAPTKALCSERAADWTRRLQPLGITVAELTGDTSLFDARGAHAAQLLVITSEKYDAVTRRWRESARTRQFVAQVGLVLLDEVHLLASSRGATLEALVARMKIVSAELKTSIRYVALSATFPNIEDVGTWLGGGAKVVTFGEEYRPVRLERLVLGFSMAHRSSWQFDRVLDAHLPNVLREHAAGKPALVFCATRKATEATAKLLVAGGGEGHLPGSMGHPFVRTSQHARALSEAAQRVRNQAAREVVVHGVAFHHAGVEMADRQLIEQLFLAGQLLVLCTTSTLAVGVNLPAYLVVLKGTQSWAGREMKEYAPMDVLQMLGRAGRPQFEASGKAIIMTTSNKVDEYESLVTGRTVVESSLHLNLIEHLNAEIAQGTITNEQLAVQWLESTFLYVRLRAAPFYYANVVHGSDNLRQLVASTLQVLSAAEMVRESPLTPEVAAAVGPRLECTEYGKLMSRYCLSLQTMQALMAGGPSIPQQLYSMALAGEFSGAYVKASDKTMLAELNKMQGIKFRLHDKYKYKSTADKVYLVVQAVLGGLQLQGKDLDRLRVFVSCEQGNVWSALGRIAAAAVELHVARRDTVPYAADRIRHAILLLQSVRTKIWFDSTRVLRQVEKLGPVFTSTLAEAGITTFAELASAQAWRLEQLCRRNPPFGTGLITAANVFPRLDVLGRFVQSTLLLSVTISNAATCKKGPNGGASWVHVLVHDEVGNLLFHDRATLYDLAKSEYKASIVLPPSVHCVFASLLAEDYVGLDVHLQADPRTRQVSVMPRWLLPESAFAPPDTSAEFVPATAQLPGPPPQPAPSAGPPGSPPPLIGSSTQPIHRPPASSATTGFMAPYQPRAPPAPAQSTHDAAQPLCKHKCKDRYKCKHACCKRGLADRPLSPIQAVKPAPKPRKKQLTLEQILQGIPEPVVVESDSDDDDAEDFDIIHVLGRGDAPSMAAAGPTRPPARKLTPPPPPPPAADGLDAEWDDLDDSVFLQAASLDLPQFTSASAMMTQAPLPPSGAQAAPAPSSLDQSAHFVAHHLARDQQQLTPPHTDTPSGDRLPADQRSMIHSPRDPPAVPQLPQMSNRGPATLSNWPRRSAIPTAVAQPGLAHAPIPASSGASMHGFRFRADLLPRVGSAASAGSGNQDHARE